MYQLTFYKEDNEWYLDLPEQLATKASCLMVGGTPLLFNMLEAVQNTSGKVTLEVSEYATTDYDLIITLANIGVDANELSEWGHQLVEYGGYYDIVTLGDDSIFSNDFINYRIWLCPTTEVVFGHYPKKMFIKHCKNRVTT